MDVAPPVFTGLRLFSDERTRLHKAANVVQLLLQIYNTCFEQCDDVRALFVNLENASKRALSRLGPSFYRVKNELFGTEIMMMLDEFHFLNRTTTGEEKSWSKREKQSWSQHRQAMPLAANHHPLDANLGRAEVQSGQSLASKTEWLACDVSRAEHFSSSR